MMEEQQQQQEEQGRESSSSSPFIPVHRALPLETSSSSTALQWKERLHEWSTHEEIDDDDDDDTNTTRNNDAKKRKKKNSGNEEELPHLAEYGISEEQIIQMAHAKLPFFRSIRELKASGYGFRR